MRTELELLFVPERNDRIHEHRPPRWEIARGKRNPAKQNGNRRERRRVRRADAEQQAFDQFRQHRGRDQADWHARENHRCRFAEHLLQHISSLRSRAIRRPISRVCWPAT